MARRPVYPVRSRGVEADAATFIMIGLRDDPDEPLKGCGAADRPCVRPLACECKERPTRGGSVKRFSPLMAGVLLVESPLNANHISSIDPKDFELERVPTNFGGEIPGCSQIFTTILAGHDA